MKKYLYLSILFLAARALATNTVTSITVPSYLMNPPNAANISNVAATGPQAGNIAGLVISNGVLTNVTIQSAVITNLPNGTADTMPATIGQLSGATGTAAQATFNVGTATFASNAGSLGGIPAAGYAAVGATNPSALAANGVLTNGLPEYIFTNMGVNVDCTTNFNAFVVAHHPGIIHAEKGLTNWVSGAFGAYGGTLPSSLLITNSGVVLRDFIFYAPNIPISGTVTSKEILLVSEFASNVVVEGCELIGPGNGPLCQTGLVQFSAINIAGYTNQNIAVSKNKIHDVFHGVLFGGGNPGPGNFNTWVKGLYIDDNEGWNTGAFVASEGLNDGHFVAGVGERVYVRRNYHHDGLGKFVENYNDTATFTNRDWRIEDNNVKDIILSFYVSQGLPGSIFLETRITGNRVYNDLTNSLLATLDLTAGNEYGAIVDGNVLINNPNTNGTGLANGTCGFSSGIAVNLSKMHGVSVVNNTVSGASGGGFILQGKSVSQGAAALHFSGNVSFSNQARGFDLNGASGGLSNLVIESCYAFNNVVDGLLARGTVGDVTVRGGSYDYNGGQGVNLGVATAVTVEGVHAIGNVGAALTLGTTVVYAQDTSGGIIASNVGGSSSNLTLSQWIDSGQLVITNVGVTMYLTDAPPHIVFDPTVGSGIITAILASSIANFAATNYSWYISLSNSCIGCGAVLLGWTNGVSKGPNIWDNSSPPFLQNKGDHEKVRLRNFVAGSLGKGTNYWSVDDGNINSNQTVRSVTYADGTTQTTAFVGNDVNWTIATNFPGFNTVQTNSGSVKMMVVVNGTEFPGTSGSELVYGVVSNGGTATYWGSRQAVSLLGLQAPFSIVMPVSTGSFYWVTNTITGTGSATVDSYGTIAGF